ncbi:MAG: acetyl-CoA C-acetyltransferase [Sphingomonadales bacterium]|nr:acetyl-CoA C-acetyltransferase [Sphingomonadales bacterium]
MAESIVIVGAARTPMGGFQGDFSSLAAHDLGGAAIRAAVERAGIPADSVGEVLFGNCLMAGQGQAPARQALFKAGLPKSTGAVTLSKMCGSGMKAAMFAHDMLLAGTHEIMVAGGMESMTNAPYLLLKGRGGYRMGHDKVYDHMMLDGLEDAYDSGRAMGTFAEDSAREYQFTRADQDEYAIESLRRANEAIRSGAFDRETTPVTVKTRKGEDIVTCDEQPGKSNPDKIPGLKPAFAKDGTITAANASSISDGAAALVITRQSVADRLGIKPVARIVAHAAHAQAPNLFTTAPVPAVRKALEKAGWSVDDVDLYEVNEAFACVAMIAMRDLGIARDRINVHGGATALGHPIGASGARILATLLSALETHGGKRGLATLCIGGGEATAMAVELAD